MKKRNGIKLIVWDLDDTIWDGTLLEPGAVSLKPGIKAILETLDARGILHSIASKNNYREAWRQLREFGLDAYFLCPQINWNAKSVSVAALQRRLNIGTEAMLFIDDQAFERAELRAAHPDITCVPASRYRAMVDWSRLNPRFITEDSVKRRKLYQAEQRRTGREKAFEGPSETFLASLNLHFRISRATENDLRRAAELTVRTHQFNATGLPYSHARLEAYRNSGDHLLLICELSDRFGSYGKIGLALVRVMPTALHLKLMLMSCRVIARGTGHLLLTYLMQLAKHSDKQLTADFRKTAQNRLMYLTYRFAHFREKHRKADGTLLLENDLSRIPPYPAYYRLSIPEPASLHP